MTKRAGFLDTRLGTIVVYCNRTKTSGLWYIRNAKGENVAIESPSFQSAEGGMRGLQIYEVTRGGKDGLKLGLILEGDDNQTYKFETSIDTAFARGMLWGLVSMTEEDIKTGQIGINPIPADPARTDSDNASTILYCNMFVNGVEMPYLSGQDVDWQEVAQKALSIANRCNYPIDKVPHSAYFLDQKTAAKTRQPARSTGQNDRSGARALANASNAPIQPPNAPRGLQSTAKSTVEPLQASNYVSEADYQDELSEDELSLVYDDLMLSLNKAYGAGGMQIDKNRVRTVLNHAKVTDFTYLSIPRKHQVVCTFTKELIEAKQPNHPAVKELATMIGAKPVDTALFECLKNTLLSVFGGAEAGRTPDRPVVQAPSEPQPPNNHPNSLIPF